MIRSFIINKYLSKEFLKIVMNMSFVFFCLGFIINLFEEINLFKDYDVLVHFSGSNPSVLHLMPPLIISDSEIKLFITALRSMLNSSFESTLLRFLTGNLKDVIR
mgnify:CR=1 FL=1